ncbi:hypothetical protein C8J57DRAFT_1503447 [Mycena rebaudengoi]|nr:hypothetical protein C8J57DRAFT_1610018 [Mycena rebaudengoi]KAJ7278568.1 hypothetical protein C8J57DRAFT_1503447 [Mycena rebaudengoi]
MAYNDGFAWTPALVNLSNQLWAVTAIIGAVLCGVVLIVIGIVALNPVCRPHLDRVSFRILVWALAANTVFGVTNAIGGKFTGPTWTCGLDIWLLQLTLELSSFLLFSIALNLQLVVVHQINGKRLEKYYVGGSMILALALTVPPYALKQYGWDPLVQDCWYSNDNPQERLAWQIGTQLFWSMLAVAGEIICTSIVVIYMLRHQLRKNRVLLGTGSRNGTTSGTRSRSGSVVAVNNQVTHANAYRGIIFRIVVYPIASAIFNLISVVCVIHATQNAGVHNWLGYRVLLLSDFVYGGRSILYALLAATDPALVRAMRAFIQHSRGVYPSSVSGTYSSQRGTESKGNISVHIELSTVRQNDSGMVTDNNGIPTKNQPSSPGTPHGYTDDFNSMLKPLSDLEEAPLGNINLQGIQVSPADLDERSRVRVQEDRARRQKEIAQLNKERQEFQRRI